MKAIKARTRAIPMVLAAILALLVVANATAQYVSFTEMRERMRARFGNNKNRREAPVAPVETNLVMNSAAGFALLGALGVIGARSRYMRRAERWEQQMTQGGVVQKQMVQLSTSLLPNVSIASEFQPAHEVGGDLYDVFPASHGRVALCLGDVSGKGLPSALLTGLIHGAVRSNPWYDGTSQHEAFASTLNGMLCGRTSDAKFATLFWGCYDPAAARLSYVSAGHCPGFVVRSKQVERLESTGPVLGLLSNAVYRQASVALNPDDILVLYSDGIIEAANAAGQEYGEERLQALLAGVHGDAAVIRAAILEDMRAFLGAARPDDDVTLLVVQATPVAAALQVAA